jgi:FdrA protein
MAVTVGKIIQGRYFDSVSLMRVARETLAGPGVLDAAAIMATAENKRILAASGMNWAGLAAAGDTDLALGVQAEDEATAAHALTAAEEMLNRKKTGGSTDTAFRPRSLEAAVAANPAANLALISVAGRYATDEARTALQNGLNVMLFSDNISLADEIALKEEAARRGLIVMGPDCGTAIIGGMPLAFANVVRRGNIGIVAASGTGLQEVSATIHNLGAGVSHAIGTGGRDVKEAVGGRTFLAGLQALKEDADTRVVVLVSKTPDAVVLEKIGAAVATLGKPVVAIFVGGDVVSIRASGAVPAATLEEAAHLAVALERGEPVDAARTRLASRGVPACPAGRRLAGRSDLRGLFCGGTFAQEAVHLLRDRLEPIRTNVTGPLPDPDRSSGHTIIDLGGDEFTVGRPHPMIDYSLRNKRILMEAQDPATAVILLDVVLGYGSHMDPIGELAPVFAEVAARPDAPPVVFHVCGTDADPQDRQKVVDALKQAGGICAPSNAAAVQWAGDWICT